MAIISSTFAGHTRIRPAIGSVVAAAAVLRIAENQRNRARPVPVSVENAGQEGLKKSQTVFERHGNFARPITVGAGKPSPSRLYSARAPIHPKRPYG
jgi:hypothetical protein